MNEFLKNIIAQYAKDRGVWVAVATWVAHFASKKFCLDIDTDVLVSLIAAVAAWAVTHFLHIKTVDQSKGIEVPDFTKKD